MDETLKYGRAFVFGDSVNTDAMAPGSLMKHPIATIASHCLESVDPSFASMVQPGDVVVAGKGFGIGSSREQAAAVLVQLGVAAVIAPSYSGLYFRNAFNLGLLLLTCAEAETVNEGDRIALDTTVPAVVSPRGARLACEPVPGFLMDMVRAGGLMNQLRQRSGSPAFQKASNV